MSIYECRYDGRLGMETESINSSREDENSRSILGNYKSYFDIRLMLTTRSPVCSSTQQLVNVNPFVERYMTEGDPILRQTVRVDHDQLRRDEFV